MNKKFAVLLVSNGNLIDSYDNIVIHEVQTEGFSVDIETTDEPIATKQYLRQHSTIHPKEFNISGNVYDKVFDKTNLELVNEVIAGKLGSVNAFLPNQLTGTALKLYSTAENYYQQERGYVSKVVFGTDNVIGLINKIIGKEQ